MSADKKEQAAKKELEAMLVRRFMANVVEARECGYDLVCVQCGCGMNDEDFEDAAMHEYDCPNRGRDRVAEMAAFLAERLGGRKP